MKPYELMQTELLTEESIEKWTHAFIYVAKQYRISCSPGNLLASATWLKGKPKLTALNEIAKEAGLSLEVLTAEKDNINSWHLPLIVQLDSNKIGVIESFDGEDLLEVCFIDKVPQRNQISLSKLLSAMSYVLALRPLAPVRDSRVDAYISRYRPDWLYKLVMRDIRPYGYVMLAALFINVLSLAGIIFSMQVYDRVIPAQSYPTLYVLTIGVLIAVIFGFLLRIARAHIMDLLGKRADMRVSDRVFGHALRLRNSAIPRSTGSFISQLRELEQIREMVTSSTISAIVDLPFFFLFIIVLAIIAPQLAWIAPVAAILMILPGLLLQKRLAFLAHESSHEATLRNAVLVESIQGIEDIKLMQAENRFLQQWNSYIQIGAESGLLTRGLTQGLIGWGITIQSLVYSGVIVVGAPLVIDGDMTTGAVVAASMLASRMVAPMSNLCGVLARWQQVKAAKEGIDSIMKLPTENSLEEFTVHRGVLHGHYSFNQTKFCYDNEDMRIALRIDKLEIKPGEKVAVLGRNGAGKSTLLQAMAGNMDLLSGELRVDDINIQHLDVADLRRNIGLMTQNARLFYGTLRENITLGMPHATDEDIFAVLKICGADNFVNKLPKGLDHPVMENGMGLSGGQRQSILLSRMLLRDPNIVLLDEPTASLDEHTEKDFIQRLSQWLGNRTLIVATHRVPILTLVERVLVLNESVLVMDAPKDKALSKSGVQQHTKKGERHDEIKTA